MKKIKLLPKVPLRIDNLSISYGKKEILKNLNFTINRGDRVALVGDNGSGKTSIIKAILEEVRYRGTITLDPRVNLAYLSQELLPPSLLLRDFLIKKGIELDSFTSLLATFDIPGIRTHPY